jgi:hypothetical protein
METLCLRNAQTRYIVSIGNKILIVTYDYHYAKRLEAEVRSRKIADESYCITVRRQK